MPDQRPALRLIRGRLSGPRPLPTRTHVRLTSAADRCEHRVPEGHYATAIHSRTGRAEAACGHVVILASLATPPGRTCGHCAEAVPDERTW